MDYTRKDGKWLLQRKYMEDTSFLRLYQRKQKEDTFFTSKWMGGQILTKLEAKKAIKTLKLKPFYEI